MIQRTLIIACIVCIVAPMLSANENYANNPAPMMQSEFIMLPLGTVTPTGWLKDQLTVQANGLTGHLDEFWPSLTQTNWKGLGGESWERGPYYLDGLIPLAYLLDDERLIQKVEKWVNPILDSLQDDGWFGPPNNKDRWPLAVAMKILIQYYEATQDQRVIQVLNRYVTHLNNNTPNWPDHQWRGIRAMENTVSLNWLYRMTGNPSAFEAAKTIQQNCYDWGDYFTDFPWTTEKLLKKEIPYHWGTGGMTAHVVNVGMAVKYPGLAYLLTGNTYYRDASFQTLEQLDEHHGQTAGRFSGDEHLSGKHPSQGTELCAVVETMYSLEHLTSIFGKAKFADRLEMLAYNANPGTTTADYWAHQYDQQSNQVLCNDAKRNWSTNGDQSNLFGLEPNFGCCTANMHQGWPKFVSSMWMATQDDGLAAVTYGPNIVKAKVANDVDITIEQITNYPFDGTIELKISLPEPTSFPLYLRIPTWAEGTEVRYGKERANPSAGVFFSIHQTWKKENRIRITFPMKVRTETRYNQSVSILRGPLYYSLKIGEAFTKLRSHHNTLPVNDWAIYPTTPWNYALAIDRDDPNDDVDIDINRISSLPFDPKNPPVTLQVKGRLLTSWTMKDNSADAPPLSPAKSDNPLVNLELIPYGSTHLRITEFPVLAD